MKTQQRKFVVEIKPKRRIIGREKSIWGNTDLKALARAVEDEVEKVFGPPGLKANDHPSEGWPQAIAEASPTPANDSIEGSSSAARPGEVYEATVHEAPTPKITQKVDEIRSRRRRRPAKSVERSRPAVSENELSVLVAENERLKRSFRDQLIRENELLRHLLARFAARPKP